MGSRMATYALSICFLSVAIFIYSFGTLSYAVIKIVEPKWTISPSISEKYQSNRAYLQSSNTCSDDNMPRRDIPSSITSEDALTKERHEAFNHALYSEKLDGIQTLLQSTIYTGLASIIFSAHIYIVLWSRRIGC